MCLSPIKRDALAVAGLFIFLLSFVFLPPLNGFQKLRQETLNVLLITIDTLRADRLSCYSDQHLETPNIDSLASRGTLFSRAFAHTPTTLPSHTNILLGTTPLHHGVHENTNFTVRQEHLTLAELLKAEGYATGAFVGAFPLDSRFGLDQGFDIYDDDYYTRFLQDDQEDTERVQIFLEKDLARLTAEKAERKAEQVVAKALSWLRPQKSPWFLWIHCYDPHSDYDPPEPFRTEYEDSLYDGEVAYTDFVMGQLFETLENERLVENTMIIFTGDHGESLGEHGELAHGFFAYNSTLWIPLIIAVPGGKSARVDQIVCHTDIYPTVCDLLSIEKPSCLQGLSLVSSMKGKKLPKRTVYFESLSPYFSRGWAPLRGYLNLQTKFIDSPIPELYDLQKDFDELTNISEGKNLEKFRKELDSIINILLSVDESKAEQRADSQTLEKLRSLGYISSPQEERKETFGPEDDVKIMLPYHYKSMDALQLCADGKVKEGVNLLKHVITERPDMDMAYANLAHVYQLQGRLNDALTVLELGLEKRPKSYEIFSFYVSLLVKARRYDRIIELFNTQSLREMDHDPEVWNYLGMAYFNKGNLERALEAFNIALRIDDRFPIVYSNLGTLYFYAYQRGQNPQDLQKSKQNYQKALELDPYYGAAYYGLGRIQLQLRDFDKAIELLNKSLELKSGIADALYFLGIAYLEKGNKSKALIYFLEFRRISGHMLSPKDIKNLNSLIARCKE
ncbi:MAG: sulfatase-like hydrolase/transferase [Candidatus Aminicenantes bacterium]